MSRKMYIPSWLLIYHQQLARFSKSMQRLFLQIRLFLSQVDEAPALYYAAILPESYRFIQILLMNGDWLRHL